MSIAAVSPIVLLANHGTSRIEGIVLRVAQRGRCLFTIDGIQLHKAGRGEIATVMFDGVTYRGELVAISPNRAILHINTSRADHGIDRD